MKCTKLKRFAGDIRGVVSVDLGLAATQAAFFIYMFYELAILLAWVGDAGQAMDRYSGFLSRQKHIANGQSWDVATARRTLCEGFYLSPQKCSTSWPVEFRSYSNLAGFLGKTPSLRVDTTSPEATAAFDTRAAYFEVTLIMRPDKTGIARALLPISRDEEPYTVVEDGVQKTRYQRRVVRVVVLP